MNIQYLLNKTVDREDIIDLVHRAELEPNDDDARRLAHVCAEANVSASAWDGDKLVGFARGVRKLGGCCYLPDLVIDQEYRNQGIGSELIQLVRDAVGEHALIMLVEAPDIEYETV